MPRICPADSVVFVKRPSRGLSDPVNVSSTCRSFGGANVHPAFRRASPGPRELAASPQGGLMYCQLLAALLIAAPPRDTIPPVAAGFMTEHASLLRSFNTLVQKAVAPTATRNDRASLVLFLRAELLAQPRAEPKTLSPVEASASVNAAVRRNSTRLARSLRVAVG